jgi:hypothetical protein
MAMIGFGIAGSIGTYLWPASGAGCVIKGNVSYRTGERIYHLPGQTYYSATRIKPAYGERWFCSEAEAQAAGWRKAKL